jgi:transposase-like protein
VILLAVRWYLRYGLSYRDVEELLAERGVEVDHVTIYRWVQRFTPLVIEAARPCRHSVGDRWFVDETYVRVAGVWRYVCRAVDQYGQVIDVFVSKRRNVAADTKFFEMMLAGRERPTDVTTDLAGHCCVEPSRGDFGVGHRASCLARDPICPVQGAETCAVGGSGWPRGPCVIAQCNSAHASAR